MKKCNSCGVKLSSWSTKTKYGSNGTIFCESCYDTEDPPLQEVPKKITCPYCKKNNYLDKKEQYNKSIICSNCSQEISKLDLDIFLKKNLNECYVCGKTLSSLNKKFGPNSTFFCDNCYDTEDSKKIIEDSKKANQNIQEKTIIAQQCSISKITTTAMLSWICPIIAFVLFYFANDYSTTGLSFDQRDLLNEIAVFLLVGGVGFLIRTFISKKNRRRLIDIS